MFVSFRLRCFVYGRNGIWISVNKKKLILNCYDGPYTPWKSTSQQFQSDYKTKADAQNQSCNVAVLRALPNEVF